MTLPPSPSSPQTRPPSHLALQTSPLAQLLLREPFPGVHSFTVLFLLQMDQPRRDHLQVSFPLVQSLPSTGLTCLLPPQPGLCRPLWKGAEPPPDRLCTPRIFGFVAKKPGSPWENVCHLFAELDPDQPAGAIVTFITKVLLGQRK